MCLISTRIPRFLHPHWSHTYTSIYFIRRTESFNPSELKIIYCLLFPLSFFRRPRRLDLPAADSALHGKVAAPSTSVESPGLLSPVDVGVIWKSLVGVSSSETTVSDTRSKSEPITWLSLDPLWIVFYSTIEM